ncbi:MAG: helix-turn-helix domain-containing protein [Minisyncoccia bacterium]
MNSNEKRSPNYQSLAEGGLTVHQAKMYETIVRQGKMTASRAARLAGVPRTLAYKALQELQKLGLIEKEDAPGKVALFSAAHPFKLKEIVDKRFEQAKEARIAVDGVLAKLISDFNAKSGSPGIRILEGVAGVAELYEDILNNRQDMKLIRSPEDNRHPELAEVLRAQIAEQRKLGIQTQAITPLAENLLKRSLEEIIARDSERLTTRRFVPAERLNIPAQILMYGNKVGITAYKESIITTIIENPAIHATFEMIFNYLWDLAEEDHRRILASLKNKPLKSSG